MAQDTVYDYIPQREPFVYISGIAQTGSNVFTTYFHIPDDCLLCSGGRATEAALIENMAQSAAAMEGYSARQTGMPVKIGFIGAVKELEISYLPTTGSRIETTVEQENQVMNINIVKCKVYYEGKIIAACLLNIFLKE
jgi:3-hydroxyacyl-[acyl-carrier-protein] dehydratase